ncbi:hypothetical protein B0H13DRAFT_2303585 [Mycena leptocephala]|nr:hypothetical protein B0H13DRAFT_2303585 [Mycena leptocephala]
MSDDAYRLRLGESTLVFFPPRAKGERALCESHVVQVMMKVQVKAPTREEVAAYFDAQEEITAAVETLLLENILNPVQKRIEIEGNGYILAGEKKDWVYGRRVSLKWGDEEARVCADKWVFHFRTCRRRD